MKNKTNKAMTILEDAKKTNQKLSELVEFLEEDGNLTEEQLLDILEMTEKIEIILDKIN